VLAHPKDIPKHAADRTAGQTQTQQGISAAVLLPPPLLIPTSKNAKKQ
jgi:hypothetical protein